MMIKKLFVMGAVLAAFSMQAQEYDAIMSVDDIKAVQGSTVYIVVNLENSVPALEFQCFVTLPEGIEPDLKNNGKPNTQWCGRQEDHALSSNFVQSTREVRVASLSMNAEYIKGNNGALFKFPVLLSGAPGVYELSLEGLITIEGSIDDDCPDQTFTITILPNDLEYTYNCMQIGDASVGFADQDKYVGMSFDFSYPSDITLRYVRLAGDNVGTHSLNTSDNGDGTTHVVVTSASDDTFSGDYVVEFYFNTPADYEGTLILTNGVATDAEGNTKDIKDASYSIISDAMVGVETLENAAEKVYFDLFGRRVINPEKGIYIDTTGTKHLLR